MCKSSSDMLLSMHVPLRIQKYVLMYVCTFINMNLCIIHDCILRYVCIIHASIFMYVPSRQFTCIVSFEYVILYACFSANTEVCIDVCMFFINMYLFIIHYCIFMYVCIIYNCMFMYVPSRQFTSTVSFACHAESRNEIYINGVFLENS